MTTQPNDDLERLKKMPKRAPTLDEKNIIRVLQRRSPSSPQKSAEYYLYVEEWREILRENYRDAGVDSSASGDIAAAEGYFKKVQHPHHRYDEEALKTAVGGVYSNLEEQAAAMRRLRIVFPKMAVRGEEVKILPIPGGEAGLRQLSEMALEAYLQVVPGGKYLAELPIVEDLAREIVDRSLLFHPEFRGHRSLLILACRRSVNMSG